MEGGWRGGEVKDEWEGWKGDGNGVSEFKDMWEGWKADGWKGEVKDDGGRIVDGKGVR